MKYRAILFDLDGTILNTDEMIIAVFHELYHLYRNDIVTPKERIYYFSGPPLIETMKEEFPKENSRFMVDEFSRLTPKYLQKTVSLYENTHETLMKFKKLGIKLGIVTNKLREPTYEVLKLFDLLSIFDVVIAIDDVQIGKPNPEGIFLAMEKLGLNNKDEILYVGDNEVDYQVAKNAKVHSALVVWGPRVLDNKLTPDIKVKSYKELEHYVEKS